MKIHRRFSSCCLVLAAFSSLCVDLQAATTVNFNFNDLGNNVDAGAQEERTGIWNLGKAAPYNRKFVIEWDMYGIPDTLIVSWQSPEGSRTHSTGSVSGRGRYEFTVSSKGAQTIKVTLNPGNGASGTAWEYSLKQVEDGVINLVLGSGSLRFPELLTSNNSKKQSADSSLDWSRPSDLFGQTSLIEAIVYKVIVPSGAKALRFRTPAMVYLNVRKGLVPAPLEKESLPQASLASVQSETANTVVFCETTVMPSAGTYYITVSKLKSTAPDVASGKLEVDCFTVGDWGAVSKKKTKREVETIIVGIEGSSNLPQASASPLTLLSHGRINSPRDMNTLGGLAGSWWSGSSARSMYVNWSEGSYANTAPLDLLAGTRFIEGAGKVLGDILRKRGHFGSGIRFVGHSWGTYVGFEISQSVGRFARFFALDPAKRPPRFVPDGFDYRNANKVNFTRASLFSMSFYGDNLSGTPYLIYGDKELAGYAHAIVFVASGVDRSADALHSAPIQVFQSILGAVLSTSNPPSALKTLFGPSLAPASTTPLNPWLIGGFKQPYLHDVRLYLNDAGFGIKKLEFYNRTNSALTSTPL